jgi:hypothetical protein
MSDDLAHLVRAVYSNALLGRGDSAAAFERAIDIMLLRRPLLSPKEARHEVGAILKVPSESWDVV